MGTRFSGTGGLWRSSSAGVLPPAGASRRGPGAVWGGLAGSTVLSTVLDLDDQGPGAPTFIEKSAVGVAPLAGFRSGDGSTRTRTTDRLVFRQRKTGAKTSNGNNCYLVTQQLNPCG